MKSFLTLLKVCAVAGFITSCAYEPDPGLKPKINAKPDVNDVLKNKTAAEKLATKYKTLNLVCELAAVDPAAATTSVAAEGNATNTEPVVVNEGAKSTVNFRAQLANDSTLVKPITESLMALGDVKVALNIKPLQFLEAQTLNPSEKRFVILKHSPVLKEVSFTVTEEGRSTSLTGTLKDINEKLGLVQKIGTVKVAEATKDLVIDCKLDGTVDANETNGFGDHILDIDCSKSKTEYKKPAEQAAYDNSCKAKDVTTPAPTT